MEDPYTVLNVYSDCTLEEAKAAYRRAALTHHPDRQPPARKEEAARRFKIIAQAFQQICQRLGHPIDLTDKSSDSQASHGSTNNKSTCTAIISKGPPSIKSSTNGKIPALPNGSSTKAIGQASKTHKAISAKPEPSGRSESSLQHRPPVAKSRPSPSQADEYEEEDSSEESEQEQSYDTRHSSRLSPPIAELNHPAADYPSNHYSGRPHPSTSRRSSFSHPGAELSNSRAPVNDYYHHPLGPKQYGRQPGYPEPRQQLYNLPGTGGGRDKQWDFGLGEDDFFSSGSDRFGPGTSMMNEVSSGFDRMMSTAFKGLSMAGPDPAELARMDGGQNCAMRMRQSKMVMGRTEDGSWAGKRMEKQMNMANGRLEINENAQDIRMGGRPGGSTRYPPREGNMRGGAEDWDPPPAYQGGGEEEYYGMEGYEPNMAHYQPGGYHQAQVRHRGHPAMLGHEGNGPMSRMGHREMVPSLGRRGSVSRAHGGFPGPDGYPEEAGRLQRRPSYGPELAHLSRPPPPMVHPAFLDGPPPPMSRSLARRASGDISARY